MKIISRKLHGFLDYLVGIVLIAIPLLFGFAGDGPATYIPVAPETGLSFIISLPIMSVGLWIYSISRAPADRCPLWSILSALPVAIWILDIVIFLI